MKRLPARPNLGQLKKQAKELLALLGRGEPAAIARFRNALPAATGKNDPAITALGLRLHDAQSCVAREYGFPSWTELAGYVEARSAQAAEPADAILNLLRIIYAGDIAGGTSRAKPSVATRIIEDNPDLLGSDLLEKAPYLACAVGDEAALRRETERDAAWVNRPGGPLALPPLVAVTHSSLLRLPAFRDRLRASAEFLLDAGADPNQGVRSRWSAASPGQASEIYRLSALYGAAGQNHDPDLTRLLLERGADPNDGESLYHALDSPPCTRLLLEAGARVTGTNALYRSLDLDSAEPLRLLLADGGDPNEPPAGPPTSDWGTPLLWAIRRRRSLAHIEALLAAGADASAKTPDGISAHALALQFGLPEVAGLLRQSGGHERVSYQDRFVAVCTRGDEAEARRILSGQPDLVATLSEFQLRLLPELAASGCGDAVRLMVGLGWPTATRGGDWQASALNHAVFRGDAGLARFLLDNGASWEEQHGFGDNALGTLAWASCNEPVAGGDWPGCAEAIVAHGLPAATPDAEGPELVVVGGVRRQFSEDVADILLSGRDRSEA